MMLTAALAMLEYLEDAYGEEAPACGDAIGSEAGFNRHRRAGEPPCDFCRTSHVDAVAAWKRKNRAQVRAADERRRRRQQAREGT